MNPDPLPEAWCEGWAAHEAGQKEEDNPYPESEDGDTPEDELHYQWYCGFKEAEEL